MSEIKLSTAQLYMLSPFRNGKTLWPSELIYYVWERAGGTQQEWEQLVQEGLVEETISGRDKHFRCTLKGRKEFDKQRKGHWI